MIPKLFLPTVTTFNSYGLGTLRDAISCTVTEERNGLYELEMQYPIDGQFFEYIFAHYIIVAVPNKEDRAQPFEIYSITKPINGVVTIRARHITYGLNKVVITPFSANGLEYAVDEYNLRIRYFQDRPFHFTTDIESTARIAIDVPMPARTILGGMDGSFLDIYGGELKFDLFEVSLKESRGSDKGVKIKYGLNMLDVEEEADATNVFNSVVPYYAKDGTVVVGYYNIPYADDNAPKMAIPVDLTNDFKYVPDADQLSARAQYYYQYSDAWRTPKTLQVSFVDLANTEEYKDIEGLQDVNLCDTVTVEYEALGISTKAKVIKTVWNVLLDRYDSIELGEKQASLAQAIAADLKSGNSDAVAATALRIAQAAQSTLDTKTLTVKSADVIPSTDDLDTYRTTGIWRTGGTIPTNCPSGFTWSQLFVTQVGTTWSQVLLDCKGSAGGINIAMRQGNSTSWGTWRTFNTAVKTVSVSIASGWSLYYSDQPVICRKQDGVVTLSWIMKPDAEVAANSNTTMFTLPSGYRPSHRLYVVGQGSGMNRYTCEITTGGDVKIQRYGTTSNSAIPAGSWIVGSASFIV